MIKELQLDGFKLSYTSEGEGSDVLLLHGFPSNMFFWSKIKNALLNNYRVTVVEQRGYPLSLMENVNITDFNIEFLSKDIEYVIDELNLNRDLIIVGHDWGSIVAWAIVSRGNVNIKKLISISGGTEFPSSDVYEKLKFKKGDHYITSFQDPNISNNTINKNLDLFFRSAYRVTPNLDSELLDLSLNNLFNSYNTPTKVHDINIEELAIHFKTGLIQPISWYSNIDLNISLASKWRKNVNTRVSFLFGKNDAAVKLNKKMKERLQSSGSDVSIKEIPNADHWLPLTHKESVLNEIYNF
jgi:pimeloyl-ACP methyl ester carboxylesterase